MEQQRTYSIDEVIKVCHLLNLHNLSKSYAFENEISRKDLNRMAKDSDGIYSGDEYKELRDYLEQIYQCEYRLRFDQPVHSCRIFFQSFRHKKYICEKVQNNRYSFSIKQTNLNISREWSAFYHLDETSNVNNLKVNAKVSTAYYNGIHLMPEWDYAEMVRDPKLSGENQLFLKDFWANQRQVNPVMLSKTSDLQHSLYGTAFIPSGEQLWIIEMEKPDVLFLSSPVRGYIDMIQSDVKSIVNHSGKQKNEAKFGPLAFLKYSSLVLLGIVVLFTINVGQWQEYRWFMMLLFWLQFQIFIGILAFIIKKFPNQKH
ncbi:hypothetical protein LRR81_17200 [Metabacillus sp. GX 13764]|uniref:hypothetical protein n=1 Tax=Metabacillus kandeliae TaxID=2900151 RepID=UPI001E5EB868|nr:hypothetical protein [Metabacillus kandeliae]MCD7035983.1 hypothetical protein [Metabacillus kandeliae]